MIRTIAFPVASAGMIAGLGATGLINIRPLLI